MDVLHSKYLLLLKYINISFKSTKSKKSVTLNLSSFDDRSAGCLMISLVVELTELIFPSFS